MKKKKEKQLKDKNMAKNNIKDLYELTPQNMSSVVNKKPGISIKFNSIYENIDLYSFRMSIDDRIVSSVVNKQYAIYKPRKDLKHGKHSVEVSFKDINNRDVQVEWYFYTIDEKTKYRLYFGVPHSHTNISSGVGSPIEAYTKSRKRELDYLIITDHSRRLSGKGTMSINKLKRGKDFDKWDLTNYEAGIVNKKHKKFLALAGFELSTSFWGHVNVYNSRDYIRNKMKNLYMFYEWLNTRNNAIISINHPNESSADIEYSLELDEYLNFIEVANGIPPKKYMRREHIYFKLLDKGWHLGVLNSQDNHKDDWGISDNLTVIAAEKLTKKAFFEALKMRRTYSTESRTLKLIVKCNGYYMGSIINCNIGDNIDFEIIAEDRKNKIDKIEIISNGGITIESKNDFKNKNKIIWKPQIVLDKKNRWYVVKVTLYNDKFAIASAIFC
ncbi:hypothetical protein CLTEP_12020 [Clostridium tepidiprofundi DSM 19306]|uniref:Polymerase/histidinol phosphatase N-terminal domain-containing protein n=1 Tax=Clostridium tepidiprofundi DSM 19306 TaxID=1121338 RepID=A0A151B503_9CLOT|nr:CehA/McbA family metallohydrolase [Clostridium tepidiprofundi]KYH34880.1 hypothetical protein CLTEP_12020 [Clostridium tepidiprofundi DSM 19306]